MRLSIDTSDPEKVVLILTKKDKKAVHKVQTDQNLSEILIPELKKFLRQEKVKISDIKQIDAAPGPGHFSRIRTGVATANALALGLGLKQGIIEEIYDKAPNITASKKQRLDKFSR